MINHTQSSCIGSDELFFRENFLKMLKSQNLVVLVKSYYLIYVLLLGLFFFFSCKLNDLLQRCSERLLTSACSKPCLHQFTVHSSWLCQGKSRAEEKLRFQIKLRWQKPSGEVLQKDIQNWGLMNPFLFHKRLFFFPF